MSETLPLAGRLTEPAPEPAPDSLVSVLDRLLDTGVVLDGQLVLTVAGVDLVYVGLRALLASVDTAQRMTLPPSPAPRP